MTTRVRRHGDTLSFHLRLTPRGGRDAIDGWSCGPDRTPYLKARVSVPPQAGKANEALVILLATTLRIAKSTIRIAGGQTARLKTIQISPAPAAIATRLEAMETTQ